jgi:branched-chain amino acid transport system ATP-binding protein
VLLDEPTAGVHPKIVDVMRRLILDISDKGTAVVIVEHNIDFVSSMAHRLLALADGKVIAHGVPDDVLNDPGLIAAYFGDAPTPSLREPVNPLTGDDSTTSSRESPC